MTSHDETDFSQDVLQGLSRRVGTVVDGGVDGRGMRIAIACSRFNGRITSRLLEGALDGLDSALVDPSDVTVLWVPGAFELPLAARHLVVGAFDAVICLGAVIRGETGHYEFVAGQCAAGLQRVQLDSGVPVIFGVLTTENTEQALTRSRPDAGNKGLESAWAAVRMASVLRAASFGGHAVAPGFAGGSRSWR
jgi:6,7-dimethyl-8-ribityllumazine synthase